MIDNQVRLSVDLDADNPVTVLREMWAKPGHEKGLEDAMSALIRRGLEWPGHLGASVIRPAYPGGPYRFVYKFDRRSNLEAWHASDARAERMLAVRPHLVQDRFEAFDGLEAWLNLPSSASHPPKWKTLLVNWVAIFPTVLLMGFLLSQSLRLLDATLHPVAATAIVTGLTVPSVAFVTMPILTRLVRRWLQKG